MQGKAVPQPPLPIAQVAIEAGWHCWRLRRELLWVLLLPAALLVTIHVSQWGAGETSAWPVRLALILAEVLVLAFGAVACHRLFLLGPASVPRMGFNGRQTREWRFAGWVFVLSLITAFLFAITLNVALLPVASWQGKMPVAGSMTLQVVEAAALVPVLFVPSRLCLVLPARAVDVPIDARTAWRMSAGNGWRLVLLLFGVPWLLHLGQYGFAGLFASDADYAIVRGIFYVLLLPFEIALLSVSYRRLRRQ